MAQSKINLITLGLSGKLGDMLIFSQRYGKTIVSAPPSYKPEQSEKQKAQKVKIPGSDGLCQSSTEKS